jgi:hypothetical protein
MEPQYYIPLWVSVTWYLLGLIAVCLGGLLYQSAKDAENLKARIVALEHENTELKKNPVEKVLTRGSDLADRAAELANTASGIAHSAFGAASTLFRLWREIRSGGRDGRREDRDD